MIKASLRGSNSLSAGCGRSGRFHREGGIALRVDDEGSSLEEKEKKGGVFQEEIVV